MSSASERPWEGPADRVQLDFVGELFSRPIRQVEVLHDSGRVRATVRLERRGAQAGGESDDIELVLTPERPSPDGFEIVDREAVLESLRTPRQQGAPQLSEEAVMIRLSRLVISIHAGLEASARQAARAVAGDRAPQTTGAGPTSSR